MDPEVRDILRAIKEEEGPCAAGEAPGDATIVTPDTFRAWKRRNGGHTAFVVFASDAEEEDDSGGVLVCTYAEMISLPAGNYSGRLVQRGAIPDAAKKRLRGSDLWRCV